ncbi:MAG: efflux RND transporter periplasmic adaptor subunit [Rhodobacteraceae bacterium]|nr:efflux RND transporter periplasmic adaptor subunit [Paracoccaceae bacterium]
MSRVMPGHRIAAIVVLVAAGAWVATGKFSSVGSDQVLAAQPATDSAPAEPADAAPVLPTVAAITPEFTEHARAIRISGVTQADKSVALAARTSGVIGTLNVVEGQSIGAGAQVIALDGADLVAAVDTAKAVLAQRETELASDEKLAAGGNMPALTLLAARTAKATAEAAVTQAQAAADKLILRAPFAGVVDSVAVEKGQYLQAGAPVATLISLDPIVVRAEVNEIDVGDIQPGSKADVTLIDGRTVEGTVRYLSKLASAVTRTFPVEVALANPDGKIPAGMTAQITLYAPPVRAVTVPRSVITLSSSGELGLRTVDAQNVTHFTPVTLVDDTPKGLVLAGVPADMRIVVSGQDLVKDGQTVDVVAPPVGGPTLGGSN